MILTCDIRSSKYGVEGHLDCKNYPQCARLHNPGKKVGKRNEAQCTAVSNKVFVKSDLKWRESVRFYAFKEVRREVSISELCLSPVRVACHGVIHSSKILPHFLKKWRDEKDVFCLPRLSCSWWYFGYMSLTKKKFSFLVTVFFPTENRSSRWVSCTHFRKRAVSSDCNILLQLCLWW